MAYGSPDVHQPSNEGARGGPDLGHLIVRMRRFLQERRAATTSYDAPLAINPSHEPSIIVASDVALDLGHPSTTSRSVTLFTDRRGLVHDGLVHCVGPDLSEMPLGARRAFAQVVMVEGTQWAGRAPAGAVDGLPEGYMVRVLPGRLWARVSRKAWRDGISLRSVGAAIRARYPASCPVEVAFVTSCTEDVESMASLVDEAQSATFQELRNRARAAGLECSEIDCDVCDEKPVCDALREVGAIRRRRT